MRTIWKFPLAVVDYQAITIPSPTYGNVQMLSVQAQAGTPCLWALVDSDGFGVPCGIYTVGTGNPYTVPNTSDVRYLGTYQLADGVLGVLAFHVFQGPVR